MPLRHALPNNQTKGYAGSLTNYVLVFVDERKLRLGCEHDSGTSEVEKSPAEARL